MSGIERESRSVKLFLESGPSGPVSLAAEVGKALEVWRNKCFWQLDAILLGYGEIRMTELIDLAGNGNYVDGKIEGPWQATVEGHFHLFKKPRRGQRPNLEDPGDVQEEADLLFGVSRSSRCVDIFTNIGISGKINKL